MEHEEKCKYCHNDLEWEDVFRIEGGIQEGYLIEHQVWICHKCNKDYIITKRVDFDNEEITDIKENN